MQRVKYLRQKLFRREFLPMTTCLLTLHDRYIMSRGFEMRVSRTSPGSKSLVLSLPFDWQSTRGNRRQRCLYSCAATPPAATSRRKLSGRAISLQQQIVARMGKGGGHMTRFPRISLHATSPGESPTFAHPFSSPRQTFCPKLSFFRRSGCRSCLLACAIA